MSVTHVIGGLAATMMLLTIVPADVVVRAEDGQHAAHNNHLKGPALDAMSQALFRLTKFPRERVTLN